METFGNERRVQQGENWNLDLRLSSNDRDYVPYIVSKQLANPYFVVTVASTKFEKNQRYVESWWNSVDNDLAIPRFFGTQPINYQRVQDTSYLPKTIVNLGELGKDPIKSELPSTETSSNRAVYIYVVNGEKRSCFVKYDIDDVTGDFAETGEIIVESENENYLYEYSVGNITDENVVEGFRYFYIVYKDGDAIEVITDYSCRIRFNFTTKDTEKWGAQNYMYQITLVAGRTREERSAEIVAYYNPVDYPKMPSDNSNDESIWKERYKYIKVMYPDEFGPDIDYDSPLWSIDDAIPVLRPTKLEVFNNLRRLI